MKHYVVKVRVTSRTGKPPVARAIGGDTVCVWLTQGQEATFATEKLSSRNPRSWPTASEIRRVVKHFEKLGLSVYGTTYSPSTGQEFCSNMDYDAQTILKYRQDWLHNRLWHDEGAL